MIKCTIHTQVSGVVSEVIVWAAVGVLIADSLVAVLAVYCMVRAGFLVPKA